MDVADMISELNDHGFDSISSSRALSVINSTMWDVCGREPWPFLEKFVRLLFTTGTSYEPDTPIADLRAVQSMKLEPAVGQAAGGNEVRYMRSDDYDVAIGNNTIIATGTPSVFTIDGQNALHFYPAPSASQVVRCRYISRPAALTAGTLSASIVLPFEYHRSVLVNGALFKLYAMEDDTDIAPTFESYYERAIADMREFMWKQQYQRPDYIHPVDLDDLGIDSFYPPFFQAS
jgi:hypothetical protein